MKEILQMLCLVLVVVVSLWLSYILFNAIINSNLPPFWKYVFLK